MSKRTEIHIVASASERWTRQGIPLYLTRCGALRPPSRLATSPRRKTTLDATCETCIREDLAAVVS